MIGEILHHPVSRGLLLANLALASLIILRLAFPMASLSALQLSAPTAPVASPQAVQAPIVTAQIEDTPAIADRPLFIETRRMPKADAVVLQGSGDLGGSPAMVDPLEGLSLSGIVVANGARIAMLKAASGTAPPPLKEGDDLRGWHVEHIEPDAVVLTANGEERRIAFAKPKQQGVTIGPK